MAPQVQSKNIPLSLKQKVYLSLGLYMTIILVIGSLSFYDLARIGNRIDLLSDYGQLTNVILEARRFEKNYLLYLNKEDFEEARNFISQARDLLEQISSLMHWNADLTQLRLAVDEYSKTMERIALSPPEENGNAGPMTEDLRKRGKMMVDLAEELSQKEKRTIGNILAMLRLQLILSVLGAVVVGYIGTKILFGKVFNALDVVVAATKSIGSGKFETLPDVRGQKELNRIIEAFNQMVRELERRQEQLVQAQKLSSLGTLTAGVAHQLNNPLNNISTSAQIALEEIEDNDLELQRRMLGNIDQESSRAREIVQGLLEFSREQGFSPRSVSLNGLLKKTLRLLSSQIPSGIEIKVEAPEDLVLCMDEQRMQEALLNLVINAFQAMPTEYGVITLRAGLDPETPEKQAFIEVQDEGVGIPNDVLKHVFDPFFTTKPERVGTGLGLSIVYGIVERHKGTIRVRSTEGKGTTITILLPLPQEPGAGRENGQDEGAACDMRLDKVSQDKD